MKHPYAEEDSNFPWLATAGLCAIKEDNTRKLIMSRSLSLASSSVPPILAPSCLFTHHMRGWSHGAYNALEETY